MKTTKYVSFCCLWNCKSTESRNPLYYSVSSLFWKKNILEHNHNKTKNFSDSIFSSWQNSFFKNSNVGVSRLLHWKIYFMRDKFNSFILETTFERRFPLNFFSQNFFWIFFSSEIRKTVNFCRNTLAIWNFSFKRFISQDFF